MSLSSQNELKILNAYNVLDSCEIIILLTITIVFRAHSHIFPGVYDFLKQTGLLLLSSFYL